MHTAKPKINYSSQLNQKHNIINYLERMTLTQHNIALEKSATE